MSSNQYINIDKFGLLDTTQAGWVQCQERTVEQHTSQHLHISVAVPSIPW